MDALTKRRLEDNIWKLKLNSFLLNFFVYSPILFVSFQEKGISLAGIGVIMAVGTIAGFLFEIPTGVLADRWGRKYMLMLAGIAGVVTMFLWTAHIYLALLTGMIFRSLVNSAISGADTALIYDTLVELKREAEYTKHNGQRFSMAMISFGVASVLASLLSVSNNYQLHFLITAFAFAASITIAWTLYETVRHKERKDSSLSHLSEAFQYTRKHREVYKIVLYSACIGATLMFLLIYIQFFMKEAGISTQYFGYIYAGMAIISTVISYNASKIEKFLGERTIILLLPLFLLIASLFLIIGNSPAAIIVGFVFMELMLGVQGSILNTYLQRHLESKSRATVESLSSFYRHMYQLVIYIIGGFIADAWSTDAAVTFVILLMIFLIIPPTYFLMKETKVKNHPA